ncbi:MAG: glutamine--fructose-6-phosphate transaminase (isomerizing) [Spirochaetaceae bacterium]|jgi:glucosamine--fructose-6-phosphate aminotransferase (isomerizing)|nr:glutamine--fructose-6-phosphate transaminase (isomerizing) [Spirochaetaceae bacterium]
MCGITGYIGYDEAAPLLIRALKKLEYRGYDSAGVAIIDNGKIFVRKKKGQIKLLDESLSASTLSGNTGIGHTRWATHGEPSDINSHPHIDAEGRIAIVHNGIIENYVKLKQWLQSRGIVFRSDTDTEVIVHIINYFYRTSQGALLDAVMETLKLLTGSYALAIVSADYPDRIIAARKNCPLITGLGKTGAFIASDVPALLEHTRDLVFLNDGEIAVLYRDHIELRSSEGEVLKRETTHIDWDVESAEKGGYPHFMLKEIFEQSKAMSDALSPRLKMGGPEAAGANKVIDFDEVKLDERWIMARRIVITACGTAYHAGIIGKYAFEHLARIPVEVDIASEYRYRSPIFDKKDIVIVISQSGETADTIAAMRLAKQNGACVFAITNAPGSTLSREADIVMYTYAGPEIAVASTKAFTTQVMCIYLLAIELGRLRKHISGDAYRRYIAALSEIPKQARQILDKKESIQRFAARQFNKTKMFFMGRQFDYPVSMESALKLKEISYTHSEAFAAGELKHGPIALVDSSTLVVTFATQNALFEKIASNIREVTSRGAASLVITWEDVDSFDTVSEAIFTLPKTEDCLSPLLAVIPAQLFAYYCAIQRGNDPDKPRNLAKSVTVE